jgi:hypothetical protein
MAADFTTTIPQNNLRLLDTLTVKHGPAPLLSRFVLEGDKYVREAGIRLRVRHDFDELVYVNRHETATGNWYPLVNMFNPAHADLSPDNSYWISGEDAWGTIVLTGAFRIHSWPDTTLEQETHSLFCGPQGLSQPVHVTAAAAKMITGTVVCGGSLWIHPDHRRHRLSRFVGRIGRAFALATWPVDWMIAVVILQLATNGAAYGYGYKHLSRSIFLPGSPLGDIEVVLAYLSASEAYDDFAEFLRSELAVSELDWVLASDRRLENAVTTISDDEVFQGSSKRS